MELFFFKVPSLNKQKLLGSSQLFLLKNCLTLQFIFSIRFYSLQSISILSKLKKGREFFLFIIKDFSLSTFAFCDLNLSYITIKLSAASSSLVCGSFWRFEKMPFMPRLRPNKQIKKARSNTLKVSNRSRSINLDDLSHSSSEKDVVMKLDKNNVVKSSIGGAEWISPSFPRS